MLLARSAPEGEADEIGAIADIAARTPGVGGEADVTATWLESPLVLRVVGCPPRSDGVAAPCDGWLVSDKPQGRKPRGKV